MKYLAGSYFNHINLKTMRIFDSLTKATEYILSLRDYNFRVYAINDKGNKIVLTPSKLEKLGYKYQWSKKYKEKGWWTYEQEQSKKQVTKS